MSRFNVVTALCAPQQNSIRPVPTFAQHQHLNLNLNRRWITAGPSSALSTVGRTFVHTDFLGGRNPVAAFTKLSVILLQIPLGDPVGTTEAPSGVRLRCIARSAHNVQHSPNLSRCVSRSRRELCRSVRLGEAARADRDGAGRAWNDGGADRAGRAGSAPPLPLPPHSSCAAAAGPPPACARAG